MQSCALSRAQGGKAHARFEEKAAGWDDMPIIRGITELERAWMSRQVGGADRVDAKRQTVYSLYVLHYVTSEFI